MMFASKTPRDLNHDPYPNVWDGHSPHNQMRADTDMYRKGAPYRYPGYSHKPRPEYDHPQHNEPNPILVSLRLRPGDLATNAAYTLRLIDAILDGSNADATTAHARRVLERLAR
jgi:hypothetical protein